MELEILLCLLPVYAYVGYILYERYESRQRWNRLKKLGREIVLATSAAFYGYTFGVALNNRNLNMKDPINFGNTIGRCLRDFERVNAAGPMRNGKRNVGIFGFDDLKHQGPDYYFGPAGKPSNVRLFGDMFEQADPLKFKEGNPYKQVNTYKQAQTAKRTEADEQANKYFPIGKMYGHTNNNERDKSPERETNMPETKVRFEVPETKIRFDMRTPNSNTSFGSGDAYSEDSDSDVTPEDNERTIEDIQRMIGNSIRI